jgi:hypothetical protein
VKKKKYFSPVHALRFKIGQWKARDRRIKQLLVDKCNSEEPLLPRDLTKYNKQLEGIRAKIFYYEAKLRRVLKAKERYEKMKQLPPGGTIEKPDSATQA